MQPVFDPVVAPGDVYTLVLRNTGGSCGLLRGPEGDPYAGGEGFFAARPNPPGWIPFSATETRLDLPFLVVVRAPSLRPARIGHGRARGARIAG